MTSDLIRDNANCTSTNSLLCHCDTRWWCVYNGVLPPSSLSLPLSSSLHPWSCMQKYRACISLWLPCVLAIHSSHYCFTEIDVIKAIRRQNCLSKKHIISSNYCKQKCREQRRAIQVYKQIMTKWKTTTSSSQLSAGTWHWKRDSVTQEPV